VERLAKQVKQTIYNAVTIIKSITNATIVTKNNFLEKRVCDCWENILVREREKRENRYLGQAKYPAFFNNSNDSF
jgi:hypothetical protein